MTDTTAAARAADTLREKAGRLRAGKTDAEKIRQADALDTLAAHVAAGLEPLRAALGAVEGVTAADRERAGNEIYALAQRRAEKGQQRQLGVAAEAGWETGGHGLPIHRATLLEAAQLYELALALHYESYWDYLRGLLHEAVGDYTGAADILETVSGHYATFGAQQAARCRSKAAGTYDEAAELDKVLGQLGPAKSGLAGWAMRKVFGALASGLEKRAQAPPAAKAPAAAPAAALDNAALERAERAAQVFAENLADGDFAAAHALLARALRTTSVDDLRTQYERMTGAGDADEDGGETTVMVMTSAADMPGLGPADLGWVYVAITNEVVNEAVTVVVTEEGGQARIRELEWGRP